MALSGRQVHHHETQTRSTSLPNAFSISNTSVNSAKGPAAEFAEVVHARHPVGLHGVGLLLGVLAAIALDLDDEVERVVMAVVDLDDEVGQV